MGISQRTFFSLHISPPRRACLEHSFFKDFIYLLLEEGKGERKKGREISMCEGHRLPLSHPQLWTWPHNPDMCPDWESNRRPFAFQVSTQTTESHQPGCGLILCSGWSAPLCLASLPPLPALTPSRPWGDLPSALHGARNGYCIIPLSHQ